MLDFVAGGLFLLVVVGGFLQKVLFSDELLLLTFDVLSLPTSRPTPDPFVNERERPFQSGPRSRFNRGLRGACRSLGQPLSSLVTGPQSGKRHCGRWVSKRSTQHDQVQRRNCSSQSRDATAGVHPCATIGANQLAARGCHVGKETLSSGCCNRNFRWAGGRIGG